MSLQARWIVLSLGLFHLARVAPAQTGCDALRPGFEAPGPLDRVSAAVSYDDGTGRALYAGGSVTQAGGQQVRGVLKWDGLRWHTVPGSPLDAVGDLVVFDDGSGFGEAIYVALYRSDDSPGFSGMARWNGAIWDSMQGGVHPGRAHELSVFDEDGSGPLGPSLFVRGDFTSAGGIPTVDQARWNGSSWSAFGIPGTHFPRAGIAWKDSPLGPILIGPVWAADNRSELRAWNGSAWSTFPGRFDGQVFDLEVLDDGSGEKLFAAGSFTRIGTHAVRFVAYHDGHGWQDASQGLTATPNLAVHDDGNGPALYASWSDPHPLWTVATCHLARWATGTWVVLDTTTTLRTPALISTLRGASTHSELLATGGDLVVSGSPTSSLARWDGVSWRSFSDHGMGASGPVLAMGVFQLPWSQGEALYLAGGFSSIFGATTGGVARWDGASATGFGDPSVVWPIDLEVFDDGSGSKLFLANQSWSQATELVLCFDGVSWSGTHPAFAESEGDEIHDLAVIDEGSGTGRQLFAGGYFGHNVAAPHTYCLASWNGTAWVPTGGTAYGAIKALAEYDDGTGPALFAGGGFYITQAASRTRVGRWNGTGWTDLGAPLEHLQSLCVFDDGTGSKLYAAGGLSWNFTTESVFRWDGTVWERVGAGLHGAVHQLAVHDFGNGPELVAAGWMTAAGPAEANGLARWDGSVWKVLGDDLRWPSAYTGESGCLASFRGDLYASGSFAEPGGRITGNLVAFGCGESVPDFCFGDGLDPHLTTGCPCGNSGAPFHGCANSASPAGARMDFTGTTAADSIAFLGRGMPDTTVCEFMKSDLGASEGFPFGDGVRCLFGAIRRLGIKTSVAGAARYPEPGDASVSSRGLTPPGSGLVGHYQLWYRNAASAFCPTATYNATNALRLVW